MSMAEQSPSLTPPTDAPAVGRRFPLTLVFVAMLAVAVIAIVFQATRPVQVLPQEGSADAGFARDMIVHHTQAVEMALLLYNRTENDDLRAIALDMMLTQQNQIGQMQGWLYLWQLPFANPDLPMTWMGMPTEGLMPGMATPDQIAALTDASGTAADLQFISLMIPHHESGIHMAEAILNSTQIPAVRQLAQSVINGQQKEISELQKIADALGAAPATENSENSGSESHDH